MARAAVAAIGLLLTLSTTAASQSAPPLDQLLERFFAYMSGYGREYAATLASEHYTQIDEAVFRTKRLLVLDSEFGIVRLTGQGPWLGFRDVIAVDGEPVPDREARLERLFAQAASSAGLSRATTVRGSQIMRESARFNIGGVQRTINNPALVLELLDPGHRSALRFTDGGNESIENMRARRIRFEEHGRPTVVTTSDHRWLPSTGTIWVDPESGRLLRAEVSVRLPLARVIQGTVTLSFKESPELGMWVPDKMLERYDEVMGRAVVQSGEATYANYRKFRVEGRMVQP